MSVLIHGMEMPTRCGRCDMFVKEIDGDIDYHYECCITAARIDNLGKKMEDCPLVPVPPHGRLIEDTAVREQIDEWLDSVGDVVVGHGLSYYGELLGCIEDAPTIIPADPAKEET